MLAPTFEAVSGLDIGSLFAQRLAADPSIVMAYGRMDVALDSCIAHHLSGGAG